MLKLTKSTRKVPKYVYTVTNRSGQLIYVFGTKADAQKYVGACTSQSLYLFDTHFIISKRTICG